MKYLRDLRENFEFFQIRFFFWGRLYVHNSAAVWMPFLIDRVYRHFENNPLNLKKKKKNGKIVQQYKKIV